MSERKSGIGSGLKIGLIIAGVLVILGVLLASSYNKIVRLEESVDTAYSDISVQLQRRNDLIPNLISTVKGYAAHETQIFEDVSNARSRLLGANTIDDIAEADQELTNSLGRLLAISEAYPDLKANENFLSLQDQLEGTENRIGTARRDYNQVVQRYNASIRSFPTNILAGMFGFDKKPLFEAAEGAEIVPEVNFD